MKIEEYEDTVFKVGKNSKENWELLKENRNYMWFHLESFSSCYVICCDEFQPHPPNTSWGLVGRECITTDDCGMDGAVFHRQTSSAWG